MQKSFTKFTQEVLGQKCECDTDSEFQADALTPKSSLVHKLN